MDASHKHINHLSLHLTFLIMCLIQQKAPNFVAAAVVEGRKIVQDFSLKQFENKKNVLLFFYPKDFTSICPTEILAFQDQLHEFEKRETQVVGCSTDTEDTHLAWLNTPKEKGGIKGIIYPLVADATKTIALNYDVLGGEWDYDEESEQTIFSGLPVAYRATFFIDKKGYIRHLAINDLSLGRSIKDSLRIIDMWQHIEKHGKGCPANWEREG